MIMVDKDELLKALDKCADILTGGQMVEMYRRLYLLPTVRCQDCRDWRTDQICKTGDDWACADFVRRNHETD